MIESDTIYALATPTPSRAHPGAISVIRLSGPRATDALIFLTERRAFERGHSARDPALPEARRLALRTVLDPKSGEAIDRGLVVWFEAPNTETGESMAELHLHGGRAVVGGALEAIRKLGFCRLAEPGEFTRRAFEHGKLDLTQAEAIADLVAAETDQQRKLALQQMDGALHRLYEDWRTLGLRALAHLEAAIDFPDEDLPAGIADEVRAGMTQLQAEIAAHLEDRRGERLRQGISIAIIGPPNAGKSSLLNLLARREAAIVSEIAGTTRDVIEVHVDLGGWPVVLYAHGTGGDFESFIAVYDPNFSWRLLQNVSQEDLDSWDAQRATQGTPAWVTSPYGFDEVNDPPLMRYEVWPHVQQEYVRNTAIVQTRLTEPTGDHTTVRFDHVVVNGPLKAHAFDLVLPKGVVEVR
jgi:tRNA U34 5-carboxymethylaminomethyl modifying GTPase MnmE/TrmE